MMFYRINFYKLPVLKAVLCTLAGPAGYHFINRCDSGHFTLVSCIQAGLALHPSLNWSNMVPCIACHVV